MDKKKLVKIGVPVLIVLLVAGVWFIKNQESVEPVIAVSSTPITSSAPAAAKSLEKEGTEEPQTVDTSNDSTSSTPAATDSMSEQGTATPLTAENSVEATVGAPTVANDPNFTLHTEKIDLETLSAYKLPMILDFGSDDCIPCKEMAPVLKKMNAEMQGKAIIRFVDVWKYTDGADGFPIQVIPTQVLVTAEGKPYVPSEEMESSGIRFTMYSTKDTKEHVFTVHQGGLTEEQMRLILKDMGVV